MLRIGQRHGKTGLQQLPQNLINCIFDRVKRASGLKGVGQLRLVSKAWKACVLQYPTAVKCRFDNDHLRKVCSLIPNMTSISIHDTEYVSIDLGALRKCSHLTLIDLAITPILGCQDFAEPIQLQDLPQNVVSVSVDRVYVDCNCYQLMLPAQAAAIRRLSTRGSDYNPGTVWSWLGFLPNLEVSAPSLSASHYCMANTVLFHSLSLILIATMLFVRLACCYLMF